MALLRRINAYSLDEVRPVVEELDRSDEYSIQLIVLNQFLFNIPDEPSGGRVGGWWVGVPGDEISRMWPFAYDKNGELQMLPWYALFRSGPPYRALDVFDSYRAAYGRRPPIAGAAR